MATGDVFGKIKQICKRNTINTKTLDMKEM